MRIVVKIGGAQLERGPARAAFAGDVRAAREAGHEIVLVHGGGNQIRALCARLGLEERLVGGLRVTDPETAEVVLAVLAGSVNRELVRSLGAAGVGAVGLSGADGPSYLVAKHQPGGADLGLVGRITEVRPELIEELLAAGRVPVLASVAPLAQPAGEAGLGPFYNVNADHAAAPLARALKADALLFLTDVPGLLDGDGSLVALADAAGCERLAAAGALGGGMLPKVEAALAAAEELPQALVKIAPAAGAAGRPASGGGPGALLQALAEGAGTRFLPSHPGAPAPEPALPVPPLPHG